METLGILLRIGGQAGNPEAQEVYETVNSMLFSRPGQKGRMEKYYWVGAGAILGMIFRQA